ncbi:MAG: acetyl-CoA carboxylase biotin carboxyl carrier protein [Bryobacteraceae bacterium]
MTIDEIKELIHVVRETGIFELEVQRGENKVRIRTTAASANPEVVLPAGIAAPFGVVAPPAGSAPPSQAAPHGVQVPAPPPAPPQEDDRNVIVKSPIVGTYYDAPGPGTPPFVKVGDQVEVRQVLCIIESMKLMNEIEAEVAGVVLAKLVDNGRPVEYGEALFAIRPL